MLTNTSDCIWDWYGSENGWIVITTNIGWKKDGCNPMGAGIAKTAAELCPELPEWYGKRCAKYQGHTAVAAYMPARMFCFPTKPFDPKQPWASWRNDSNLDLIRRSCRQLMKLVDTLTERGVLINKVGLPLPGCGNGNLSPSVVKPIIADILDDRFVLYQQIRTY